MSSSVTLPASLSARIQEVARRVRWLRALRGASLVVLLLALTAVAAILADHWLQLPALVRQINLGVWLALGSAAIFTALVTPLCRRLDPVDLAAAIEQKYPELGERLTSS